MGEVNKSIKISITNEKKEINIPVVHVDELHNVLDFKENIDYPNDSLKKSLVDFKMEIDDSPIFRYIYRNYQPKRHLEFGTWQGTGVTYCLEESNATVWTINLPYGEKKANGDNIYGNYSHEVKELQEWAKKIDFPALESYNTDSIGFIGRRYLEKGLGNRVCQIYCDSTQWDISNYPSDFFDSVLIDGAHIKDIVISDTEKAFSVLKKGGLVMWHDFCPPIWKEFEVTRGVMEGIASQWEFIIENTCKLFWIEPSWILLGIKK